ncbi:hypothetical protein BGX23_012699 [Mortierella sp. AD031]|nr:hypothetical protein BGX23_012699 [Mortierella sp. AD031]
MTDEYQCFRSKGELVRVKVSSHPSTNARYIFWGDIRMCFPGMVRIQHNDIYVPFMRCRKEYRLKPLRIQHVPDVLDVIYVDDPQPAFPASDRLVSTSSTTSTQPSYATTSGQPSIPHPSPSMSPISALSDHDTLEEIPVVQEISKDQPEIATEAQDTALDHTDLTQDLGNDYIQDDLEKSMKEDKVHTQSEVEQQVQGTPHESMQGSLSESVQETPTKQAPEPEPVKKQADKQVKKQATDQSQRIVQEQIQDKIQELMQRMQTPGQKPGQQKVQKKVPKPVQKPTPKQVPGRLRDLINIQVPKHLEGVDIDNLTIEEFIKLSNQSPTTQGPGSQSSSQSSSVKLMGSSAGRDTRGTDYNLAVDIFIDKMDGSSGTAAGNVVGLAADQSLFKLIEAASASSGQQLVGGSGTYNLEGQSTLGVMNTALERAISHAILGAAKDFVPPVVQPSTKELAGITKVVVDSTSTNASQNSSSTAFVPADADNGDASGPSGGSQTEHDGTQAGAQEQGPGAQDETAEDKAVREAALVTYEIAKGGLVATTRLFQAFIQASAKGHLSVADKIGLELNRQLEELEGKLDLNSLLRPQFAQLCKALSDTQRSLYLIREPLIQNRIQAILANRMGVLDQQVPRIFIILPKPGSPGDFRVHFLCECGDYTDGVPRKGKAPNHIHLTDHPGYDIKHKREFLETYGSYMLDFLNLFKYGVTLDWMTIPPLDPSSELLARVHESMECLMNVTSAEPDYNGFLRNVGYCLQGHNPREACIGSLYRLVSMEGDTRWICQDHYKQLQLDSCTEEFAKVAKGCKAYYSDPHHCMFHMLLPDRSEAELIYAALEDDPPIQDVGLLLDWNVTPKDLDRALEVLRRLTTPIIRLFIRGPATADNSLKASKDALYAYMLGNVKVQVFIMGEIDVDFKRSEPHARLMRVRRDLELKTGLRDMFTTLNIVRDSQRRTNITLAYHSVERGLEMVKKHMGSEFSRLAKLDLDAGGKESAMITFKNGDTVKLHLRALSPTSNYLLLSSLIRSLDVTISEPQQLVELEKVIKRNQGMDSLDIQGPRRIMVQAYNTLKAQFSTHPGLNRVTMMHDRITLSFNKDPAGPALELQTFVATGLDEIVNATAADLTVFFAKPSDVQARMFELGTKSESVALELKVQPTQGDIGGTSSSNSDVAAFASKVSRLTMLNLDLSDLTRPGLESFARVINNSPRLEKLDLRIYCSEDSKMDWVAFGAFMGRVCRKITGLLIKGPQFISLLQQLVLKIPHPATLMTSLAVFEIRGAEVLQAAGATGQAVQWTAVEQKYFKWIDAVVRLPSLTHLSFRQVWIDAAGWETIVDAMNFHKLIRVDIQDANFGTTQMDRLANLMGPDSLKRQPEGADKAVVVAGAGAGAMKANKKGAKKGVNKDDNGDEAQNGDGSAVIESGEVEEPMSLFSMQLLCVFLCEAPDNDMLQRWDYLLKFRTDRLLYQCEMDPLQTFRMRSSPALATFSTTRLFLAALNTCRRLQQALQHQPWKTVELYPRKQRLPDLSKLEDHANLMRQFRCLGVVPSEYFHIAFSSLLAVEVYYSPLRQSIYANCTEDELNLMVARQNNDLATLI